MHTKDTPESYTARGSLVLIKSSNGKLWHEDREGSHEALVLRYANCSLRCYICYAQRYAYLNIGGRDVISCSVDQCIQGLRTISAEVAWIRIQGGKPLISDSRSTETAQIAAEALKYLSEHGTCDEPKVIIQTNGLWFAKTKSDRIKEFVDTLKKTLQSVDCGRIVIEISFKGPNIGDANLYALSRISSVTSTVFIHQLQGFKSLFNEVMSQVWQNGIYRLAIYPVAGLGPEIGSPGFIPLSTIVSAKDEVYPIFHQETWSDNFADFVKLFKANTTTWHKVYSDHLLKHGGRLPIEGMSPSMFQFGWISQITKRPELESFIHLNMRANWNNPSLNLFRTNYPFLCDLIEETNSDLLRKISDLNSDFYNSKPSVHYPYL